MARRKRSNSGINIWPGYVDALSTLVMVVMFVLLVFVIGQQFLGSVLVQREHTLDSLKQDIARLGHMLSLSQEEVKNLTTQNRQQAASLLESSAEIARDQATTTAQLSQITELSSQVSALNAQLASVSNALDIEQKNEQAKDAQISDLGQRLNTALADKVTLLKRYRSEFFEKLSKILKNQPGISVVGDRFIFQSEILFPAGSAELTPAGRAEIRTLAKTFKEVANTIPANIPWILRVDGHADRQPIHTAYPSNWELSSARAITVVNMLIAEGIDPHHLAATGFSVYQPLDKANTAKAYAHNRRIEFRLTDR